VIRRKDLFPRTFVHLIKNSALNFCPKKSSGAEVPDSRLDLCPEEATQMSEKAKASQPIRLYTKAIVLGYRRSHVNQYPQWSLLRLEGVRSKDETDFYLGKRVAYIYRAGKRKAERQGKDATTRIRVIWGRIAKSHGNNGVVRARFRHNLPPKTFGATVRVMLYPSRV